MSVTDKSGYQESAVGWIPSEWQVTVIGDLAEVSAGGTPATSHDEYWNPPEVPWMSSGEVHLRRVRSTEKKISKLGLENSAAKVFPKKSIVMALAGQGKTRGCVAVLEAEAATNQSLAAIYPSKLFETDFLFHNLDWRYKELRSLSSGEGGRGGLNLSIIKSVPVALPPLPEQQKIAAILTTVDDKLEVIACQIDATQTIKRGLMQTVFSRGVGIQDANGRWLAHTDLKDSEVGEIPVGWVVRSLESVANVERGKFSARPRNDPKYFEDGNIPFIQTGDIASSTRFVRKASQFLNLKGLEVSKLFPVGTIFITIAANIGDVAIAKTPMACPDSVVGINITAEVCDGTWLYYLLKNSKDYFDSRATQNAQKNINLQVLRPFLFALPPMLEQQRVAEILSSLDEKLDVLSSKQAQYKALKRGLMQKLLTGEWRVKLDAPEEAVAA
ncbi:restriction endonuclease subunit S [Paraburkholderia aspalathi]|uniref:Type I restriction enzyme, S subunit n=1 Tax=Paraburkholderia aspalathi TaxID=1324617 RepID=A0A1I7CD87_9BURK|nr:restriction endonuclease subunit S [Paraburkholderia aspalathi]SFT97389.1 type I restriction enzyme, S subunit [Paraburkholderia aspalathi]